VEPRQAGETAVCPCGASLPIPTMLEILALEPAPVEPTAARELAWGWRQAVILLGFLASGFAVVAFVALVLLFRPIAAADVMDPVRVLEVTKSFQPAQTWVYWSQAKQGLDRRSDQQYAAAMLQYRIWQAIAGVVFIAGVASVAGGIAAGRKKMPQAAVS